MNNEHCLPSLGTGHSSKTDPKKEEVILSEPSFEEQVLANQQKMIGLLGKIENNTAPQRIHRSPLESLRAGEF